MATLRRLALLVVTLGLLLAVAEVLARLVSPRPRDRFVSGFVEADPDLVWRLRRIPSGPIRTNELGYRDTPYRPAAEHRILVLGDSVSWGDSVGDVARVYPQVLERILAEKRPATSFEVINASVPGYSTFQERRLLERDGLALEPEAIVLQFTPNDVVGPYHALAAEGGDTFFMGIDTRYAAGGVLGFLLPRSRVAEAGLRGLQRLARRREEYDVRKLTRPELSPELVEAWRRTTDEIDAIAGLAARRGARLLLLIVPYRFQLDDPSALRQPQDHLIAHARRTGLLHVDLLPYFAQVRATTGARLFADESHLNERGHALAAQVLSVPLLEVVDGRRPGRASP